MRFFFILATMTILTGPLRLQAQPPVHTGAEAIPNQPAPTVKKLTAVGLNTYIAQCDHPLIVNFWATYCTPCLKEIPYFQHTVEKYKDQGVELLLVSLDRPDFYPARIAAFAQKNGYTRSPAPLNLAWLNERDPAYFCPVIDRHWSGGLPSSLFINSSTHYRRFFDRQLTDLQVEPTIKAMLAPGN